MTTSESDEVTRNFCNLEKYDPYIETIRALFVPSLEPRIYSCLETFVYHKDAGQSSDCPDQERCLDVAASNLRPPVATFCTDCNVEGVSQNFITQAIKFLIKDGFLDCFINSIILNNRLNNICRHLDELGIEKDFLRYLAVWNYINERNYWIEGRENTSRSTSEELSDSVDGHSDLDVEIGSRLCYYTKEKESGRSLKRPVEEVCSEDSQRVYDSSDNCADNEETRRQVENWLGLDSIARDKSKTNEKMRQRSISRNFSCIPFNCPTYRLKNQCQSDWDGKILKLKLSEVCCSNSKNFQQKSMKLSKLQLPCEYDNLTSHFGDADTVIQGLGKTTRKKKFRATLVNICRRINELLRKFDKNEVKRCSLHCQKFPNHLDFKITKRESNGCKVCLLTDRLFVNKIEDETASRSRDSSFGKLSQIIEDDNSRDSDSMLSVSPQHNLDFTDFDKKSKCRATIDVDPHFREALELEKSTNSKRLIDQDLSLNRSIESGLEGQTCNCDTVEPSFDRTNPNNNNVRPDFSEDFKKVVTNTIPSELTQNDSSKPRYTNSFQDDTCVCNGSFDSTINYPCTNSENQIEVGCNDRSNRNQVIEEKLSLKKIPFHSTAFEFENQTCSCMTRDSFEGEMKNIPKGLAPKERSTPSVDLKIQSPEPPKALTPRTSVVGSQRRQTLLSKAFIDLPPRESWAQSVDSNISSQEPFKVLEPKESSYQSMDPMIRTSKDQFPKEPSIQSIDPTIQTSKKVSINGSPIQGSQETINNQVCPCSFPTEKSVPRSAEEYRTVMNEDQSPEPFVNNIRDLSAKKQSAPNELCCIFDSQDFEGLIDPSLLSVAQKNCAEHERKSLGVDVERGKSFTKVPIQSEAEISFTEVVCGCPSDCTCPNKKKSHAYAGESDFQHFREFREDQGASKLLNPPNKDQRNRDVWNQTPDKSWDASNVSCFKAESNSIETQVDSKEFEKFQVQRGFKDQSSDAFGIPVETSRSLDKMKLNAVESYRPDDSSKINGICEKSICDCAPLLSAKFPRPKGQRINISIELCPESDGSINKIRKSDKKSVRTLALDSKNLSNFEKPQESRIRSSSRQLKCQSVDSDKQEIRVNQTSEINTIDEWCCETNGRLHSPVQPLEFRDNLPSMERVISSMRNTSLYENPIKSGSWSNRKFEQRSMSQSKKIPEDCQTREFYEPIRNNDCCEKNIRRESCRNKNSSSSPRSSARYSSSVINGHLCYAFSSSSVDRMRHLIKTKLRRILLERDKSTNTPKIILSNKKYRVSVPIGKTTERLPLERKCCRTIWESHSASNSTPASRSFVSQNRAGICAGSDMCQLLYSSSKRSKKSSSNFESISRDSDFSKNDSTSIDSRSNFKRIPSKASGEMDFMKERPVRLSGGSDFIPDKKIPEFGNFTSIKSPRPRRTINENPELRKIREKKLFAYSKNCDLLEHLESDLDPSESRFSENKVFRNSSPQKFIACSEKLDSSLKSTSRHIYFYPYLDSSNDQLFDSNSRQKEKTQSPNKFRSPEILNDKTEKKLKSKENVHRKNRREYKKRSTSYHDDAPSGMNILNKTSRTNATNSPPKAFNYLDSDLRLKLSQYVSLCKSVKYSLLKRLRPNDTYEVSGTSISYGDQLKL